MAMDYERIDNPQTGMISPSKLRMKLMRPQNSRKKNESSSNSSKTSPSRLQVEEADIAKNSLLSSTGDFDQEGLQQNLGSIGLGEDQTSHRPKESAMKEKDETGRQKSRQSTKVCKNLPPGTAQAIGEEEDEALDYDSNASSSSFEFHRGERSRHNAVSGPFSRPIPSKWNDAEKWIVSRQAQSNHNGFPRRNVLYSQMNRMGMTNMVRVAPDSGGNDQKPAMNKVAVATQPDSMAFEKFCYTGSQTTKSLMDESTRSSYQTEEYGARFSSEDTTAALSVCMRDTGTEMTPMTSQEPSRTTTPAGATTPHRSPSSSAPSTPRGVPAPTNAAAGQASLQGSKQLSEHEMKEKTRREILALGVQLGKSNIATWASKEGPQRHNRDEAEEPERIEFDRRAKDWEEAEKSKHAARHRREEIKIQAWEDRQKAKFEAELQRIEAKIEQVRAQARAKMVKKITLTKQISGKKHAAAEARKNKDEEKTAAQAEFIRQTGQMPSANRACCGWWSM